MLSNTTKKELQQKDRLDLIFHALADKTRRSLLETLSKNGESTITELAEPFDMSLPAVSRHIRVLESASLVSRMVDGRIHRCSFDAKPLKIANDWINYYEVFWTNTLDKLAQYVEENEK